MNKWYSAAFLIIAVVSGLLFVLKLQNKTVTVQVHTISDINDSYEIYAEYPQFTEVGDEFNEKIEETVQSSIDAFKKEVSSRDTREGSLSGEPAFLYTLGWSSAQMNEKIISFLIQVSRYTGGAHGEREIYTFSYDVEGDEEIILGNIFKDTPKYLERIAQYAMGDLKIQLQQQAGTEPNTEMILDGASPKPSNYSHFTVGPGEIITFYFKEYQVAPYAAGQQKVVMPISFIRSEIKNE